MLQRLDVLATASGAAWSLYLPRGSPTLEVETILRRELEPQQLEDAVTAISKSATGAVLFWGDRNKYLIQPPFPLGTRYFATDYDVQPLRALLSRDLTIAVILVRLGDYAIGVFHGEKLISSKVGTGNVHQRHRQGGSSAHRFERHRDKQIEYFFTRICTHAQEHLTPVARQLDYLVYGGTRFTVLELRKQCHFLQAFDVRTLDLLLNVRQPRQATLEAAIGDVWSSKVTEWREKDSG